LQKIFQVVEDELNAMEMSINPAKSSCIRFGPRYEAVCTENTTQDGSKIPWVKSCKYLGIEMLSSRSFKCVFDTAKKSFYKSFNAIFGKIGRYASEDTVVHLLKIKCLPVLLYGLNACPVSASDHKSLDFTIFRTLAKIFGTFSQEIIKECRLSFNIPDAADLVKKHKVNFLMRYSASENLLCQIFAINSTRELIGLRK
jgi:hypothetical protein